MSLAIALLAIAGAVSLAAWIWFIVVAFRHNEKIWGALLVASLILPIGPFVALVFCILHWPIARRPAFALISSALVAGLGTFLLVRQAQEELAQLSQDDQQVGWSPAIPAPPEPTVNFEPQGASPPSSRAAKTPRPTLPPTASPIPPPLTPDHPDTLTPPPTTILAVSESTNRTRQPRPEIALSETHLSETTNPPIANPHRDLRLPPARIELLRLGEAQPNQIRRLQVRLTNETRSPIREVKIDLEYFGDRGQRLGSWTTIHPFDPRPLAANQSLELEVQAFFVPQLTRQVRLTLKGALHADGTRWPPSAR
jgi:hypothetical protein